MEWFEDESFWRDGYDLMFGEEAFRKAPEQVNRLLALTGIQKGKALDLCCGPGRHAVALAKKGFGVTGVDLSPLLLEKARQHAVTSDTNVEFVLADMGSFVRPNAFDLALNFFTAFGYFADRADDQKVLTNIYSSLRPGGCSVRR